MGEQQELPLDHIDFPGSRELPDELGEMPVDWLPPGRRFSNALQYPSTIIPLFVAALAVMAIILEQLWLPTTVLWIVTIAMLAAAAGSFLWFYILRYEEDRRSHMQERIEYQVRVKKARELRALQELRETLRNGFTNIGSVEGEKALTRLANDFDQLRGLIKGWPHSSLVSITQIQVLTEQTYRQGLNVLNSVLDLLMAIEASDKKGLAVDVQALETEIEDLIQDDAQIARLEIRRAMLSEIRGRLELLNVQELRAEEFLLKSSLIEGSLNRTRMELATLKVDSSESGVNSVTEALQKTIDQARNVLDEMRELGF